MQASATYSWMAFCRPHYCSKENEKMHVSCELDQKSFFIKTQLRKLRVVLRSRVSRGVYPGEGYKSVTPLLVPASTGLTCSALFCARKRYNPQ